MMDPLDACSEEEGYLFERSLHGCAEPGKAPKTS